MYFNADLKFSYKYLPIKRISYKPNISTGDLYRTVFFLQRDKIFKHSFLVNLNLFMKRSN